ncbi:efflux RND transporter periplasmic adaptor subunit [Crassaminicella profunda]|uniref:efflux RND transporter periplasmic adaptor subunit n=1 Tax=Crassaminicella profunda TaxID=1286698 RepID=UPI001CA764E9|nr:efflux RND transporter periplasmic adaptor subunit [Crassaminicella profunda]QZY54546.1 efflux RND transporter periplasmic adaptor subunit [Crassaminicella profunda]
MKKKWIIIGIMILITGGILYTTKSKNKISVEVSKAFIGEVSKYVEETGTIKSHHQRIVHGNSSGEITTIHVTEGDLIKKDQLLAEINTEKINLKIKAFASQIESLKAEYQETIKPTDKEKISQTEGKVANAKLELDEAKKNLTRNKILYEQGALSKKVYEDAVKDVSIKENLLSMATNELQLLKNPVSSNIKDKYHSQISQLLYQKEVLEKEKEDLLIKAPMDGIITEVFVKNGGYIQPGTRLLEIAKKDDLYVEVDVLASEISEMIEKNPVFIESDDLNIKTLQGTVTKIFPKAFSKVSDLGIEQKRVRVHTSISKFENLKIGYEVDVKFEVTHKENILTIPENAIFSIDDEKYVFVVDNHKALLRKIETGLEGEDHVEILSGIKKGDQVILSPSDEIENGTLIKVENPS